MKDKNDAPRRRFFLRASLAASTFVATAGPAFAQDGEIIVTAQKREQSIMDVGVAVTAM